MLFIGQFNRILLLYIQSTFKVSFIDQNDKVPCISILLCLDDRTVLLLKLRGGSVSDSSLAWVCGVYIRKDMRSKYIL